VSAARTPPNNDVAVTGGQDLLDVEVQIGERRDVELEELTGAPSCPAKGAGKTSDSQLVLDPAA